MEKKKIDIDGLQITINKNNYVSLTDLARGAENPSITLLSWLRNYKTLQFLETWEEMHNSNFNLMKMHKIRLNADNQRQLVTAQRFIKETGAIGMTSKAGRYGGTFAHYDIALHFCFWYDPKFQVYFVKEFKRLKEQENKLLNNTIEFSLNKIIDEADKVRIFAELGKESLRGKLEEEE